MSKKIRAISLATLGVVVLSMAFTMFTPTKTSAAGCVDLVLRQGSSKYGFTGNCVGLLQQMLNGEGEYWNYPGYSKLVVDKDFGWRTKNQVYAAQKFSLIQVDGVVGRQTWTALCNKAKAMTFGQHSALVDSTYAAGWAAGCASIVWY